MTRQTGRSPAHMERIRAAKRGYTKAELFMGRAVSEHVIGQLKSLGLSRRQDLPDELGLTTQTINNHVRKGTLTVIDLLLIKKRFPKVSIDRALTHYYRMSVDVPVEGADTEVDLEPVDVNDVEPDDAADGFASKFNL